MNTKTFWKYKRKLPKFSLRNPLGIFFPHSAYLTRIILKSDDKGLLVSQEGFIQRFVGKGKGNVVICSVRVEYHFNICRMGNRKSKKWFFNLWLESLNIKRYIIDWYLKWIFLETFKGVLNGKNWKRVILENDQSKSFSTKLTQKHNLFLKLYIRYSFFISASIDTDTHLKN